MPYPQEAARRVNAFPVRDQGRATRPVVDRVSIGGSELDALESRFRDAGLDPERGGSHEESATTIAIAFRDRLGRLRWAG